jgi:hypothetical protein
VASKISFKKEIEFSISLEARKTQKVQKWRPFQGGAEQDTGRQGVKAGLRAEDAGQ